MPTNNDEEISKISSLHIFLKKFQFCVDEMNLKMRKVAVSVLVVFLLVSFFNDTSASNNRHLLRRGAKISVEDDDDDSGYITSPDNTFACGFYELGENAYWFAIWFTNSKEKTVVWMANRDRPVNGRGSVVSLRRNGIMILTDLDGTVVWVTNSTSTDAVKAELLNSGNLVLKNSEDDILWQSFDYPTDTLLPTQTFTKSKKLISPLRKGSFESGYFNLYYDSNNVLSLIYDGPEISSIYWPNPDFDFYRNGRTNYNSSRIGVLDEMGRFLSSDRLQFNTTDMGFGVKRRLTIDYDGNLRIYSLINATGLWIISWQAVDEPCTVRGLCGRNGICVYNREVKCSCPPGHVVSDPSDWNKGCKPQFNLTSSNSQRVKFLEIPHTDYYGFDLNFSAPITFEACREICLGDFRCRAFSYRLIGTGQCYAKSELFNGYNSPDFAGIMYLKVPESMQASESEPVLLQGSDVICASGQGQEFVNSPSLYQISSPKNMRWVYLYSFCSAIGALEVLFFALGWFFVFRKRGIPASVEAGYQMIANHFRKYSYDELKKATKNFKEELGRGGSGAVYKGELTDGRAVAIKRLGDLLQAEQEFWAETSTIGKIYHMNLVRMWGYCSETRHRLLVYEYVENSSLDKHLFSSEFLGWRERFAVAIGTARGLAYLHHECLEWVIHCDVKPENILLDRNFQPKIADFGLAKLSQRNGPATSVLTKIRGTKGYMAPEWTSNHPITAKVDVYSYGVVILEIVRGIRVSNWVMDESNTDGKEEAALEKFVRKYKGKFRQGEENSWVETVVDPRLDGEFSRNQAATLVEIGLSCVEEDRNKRPTMASVVQTLLECEE